MGLFVRNEPVENSQHALAVLVDPIQIRPKCTLKVLGFHPFVDDNPRHVDVLPESVQGMPAEEETVEESGFPLRRQRIVIVSWSHELSEKTF